jgi:hypothetical protein
MKPAPSAPLPSAALCDLQAYEITANDELQGSKVRPSNPKGTNIVAVSLIHSLSAPL